MQYTNLHNVSISQFRKFFSDAGSVGIGDDFCIIDVNIKDNNRVLAHPFRIDGYMVLYCINGHIKLNVNLQEHELKSGMLFLNYPGSIIRVNDILDVSTPSSFAASISLSTKSRQILEIPFLSPQVLDIVTSGRGFLALL